MRDVNQILYDLSVSHQIGLQRLSTATVRKVLALVDRVERDVLTRLSENQTRIAASRLERQLASLQRVFAAGYEELTRRVGADAAELATYEAEYQQAKITSAVPLQIEFVLPAPEQLQAAATARPFQGRYLSEWGSDLADGAFKRVRDAVRVGYAEGQTTPQIVQRIRGTRGANYRDGITQISRRGAEGMARTALNHTANYARDLTYQKNADLIKGVRWVSTLDLRTTPICRARDGQVFPLMSGPRPPAHWACRSTTSPVMKSWQEMGVDADEIPESTRASMNGQVPETETYQTWLGRQSATVQDDVLGRTRGLLFRNGGLTLDRFVDQAGRELTLPELRRRDAAAFAAAGIGK